MIRFKSIPCPVYEYKRRRRQKLIKWYDSDYDELFRHNEQTHCQLILTQTDEQQNYTPITAVARSKAGDTRAHKMRPL
jgi:hypothetical protein